MRLLECSMSVVGGVRGDEGMVRKADKFGVTGGAER